MTLFLYNTNCLYFLKHTKFLYLFSIKSYCRFSQKKNKQILNSRNDILLFCSIIIGTYLQKTYLKADFLKNSYGAVFLNLLFVKNIWEKCMHLISYFKKALDSGINIACLIWKRSVTIKLPKLILKSVCYFLIFYPNIFQKVFKSFFTT